MPSSSQTWLPKIGKHPIKITQLAVEILCALLPHLPDREKEIKDKGNIPEEEFRWWLNKKNVDFLIRKKGKKKAGCFIQCTKDVFEVMYLYKEGYKERHLIAQGIFMLLRDALNANRINKDTVFQISLDEGRSQMVTERQKLRSLQRKQEAKQEASENRKIRLRSWYSELFGVKFAPNGLDGRSTCYSVSKHLLKTHPYFD